MGGSSSRSTPFGKKKKTTTTPPLKRAWSELTGALPQKNGRKKKKKKKKEEEKKKKRSLSLDKLNLDNLRKRKSSSRRFSLPTDKKEARKRFSLADVGERLSQKKDKKKKDGGGLGKVGEQIKMRFPQGNKKELSSKQEVLPPFVNWKETKGKK
ncbi:hypothetical protein F2P81_009956 [Scophthalmus maximus]|uniref:Uncharacterized protein n=1 Tax=Scophthalmus maximus TaxID=52904 RepID=A0A6A4T4H7_SCOMX|nr:hypothetical protein F2P81_009956 [Scophthalmus maximus]